MNPDNGRSWLTDAILGRLDAATLSTGAAKLDMLLAQAEYEGVSALVAAGLNRHLASGSSLEETRYKLAAAFEAISWAPVATSMQLELHAQQVLGKLQELQLPALLLKGSALAYWAYAEPHLRACSDVDLLLASRSAAEQLAEALVHMGYTRARTSGELVAYELLCTRQASPDWALELDVHWQLTNSPLFARAFSFDELMAESIALPQLAPNARGLGPVHALLHAAMHRALNLSIGLDDKLKWLHDFVALTRGFSEADWASTAKLAAEKRLAGTTLDALETADHTFALALPEEVRTALRKQAQSEPLDPSRFSDWRYMQGQTFRALPNLGTRVRWLWQRVFPSTDYLQYLYGDQGSYAMLMRERWRNLWRKWAKS